MPTTMIEWTYNEDGEPIDVFIFKSGIVDIPTTPAEQLDLAAAAALAELEAKQQSEG